MNEFAAFGAGAALGAGGMLLFGILKHPEDGYAECMYQVAKRSYFNGRETMRKAVIRKVLASKFSEKDKNYLLRLIRGVK